jgi:hypothetical protein
MIDDRPLYTSEYDSEYDEESSEYDSEYDSEYTTEGSHSDQDDYESSTTAMATKAEHMDWRWRCRKVRQRTQYYDTPAGMHTQTKGKRHAINRPPNERTIKNLSNNNEKTLGMRDETTR